MVIFRQTKFATTNLCDYNIRKYLPLGIAGFFRKIFLIVLIFVFGSLQSQKLSRFELKWALFHPVAAIKVKCISKKCEKIYNEGIKTAREKNDKSVFDNFSYGGKQDAFRHIFYMAAFARKINIKKLRKLGKAHEKSNYRTFLKGKTEFGELPDSIGTVMDLNNNEIGFKLGHENKKTTLDDLQTKVVELIKNGQAQIMKRNAKGEYLDCEGKIIHQLEYKMKWGIPKCLVPSNTATNTN